MGRPRVKTIDDSAPIEEKKTSSKLKIAKSETAEAISEVENETGGEASGAQRPDEQAIQRKPQKPGKAKPRSKKYQEVVKDLDRTENYPLSEIFDKVKKMSYAKFNATIEAHINTVQTGIRGLVSLPYASGKKLRILAFGPSQPQLEGVVFGSDETIEEINKGKVDFDLVVTTPEWMPKLAKIARILGPRGLMPNPKNGTITGDTKKTIEGFQAGKTEYKTEGKAPVIHLAIGKVDQPNQELIDNVKILVQTLGKTKVKKISLSPTMGPGVKLDLSSI